MTLRDARPGCMHLRTAVASLGGLTPDVALLDRMAHKMAQNAKSISD
ncbi:MAG: hypothetical protein H8K04_07040 [Nitrospira sp.]